MPDSQFYLRRPVMPHRTATRNDLGKLTVDPWRSALTRLALTLSCCAGVALAAIEGKEPVLRTEANRMVELTLKASRTYADPFNEVTLDVTFMIPRTGTPRAGVLGGGRGVEGALRLAGRRDAPFPQRMLGGAGTGPARRHRPGRGQTLHGPKPALRSRSAPGGGDQRYLEHADGTPFFWLGDTWWMGLCHRLHWPEEFQKLAADRKAKGFNVIQIVAGLYPDMPPFDPRGANEAGFPWETNYTRIRPEYFDAADQRLGYLVEQGFTPCIVGAWGYFMPWMGVEKVKAHWRYLVARYGALPVVWCVAGEANLPYYLAKGFPYDDREQVKTGPRSCATSARPIRFTGR